MKYDHAAPSTQLLRDLNALVRLFPPCVFKLCHQIACIYPYMHICIYIGMQSHTGCMCLIFRHFQMGLIHLDGTQADHAAPSTAVLGLECRRLDHVGRGNFFLSQKRLFKQDNLWSDFLEFYGKVKFNLV